MVFASIRTESKITNVTKTDVAGEERQKIWSLSSENLKHISDGGGSDGDEHDEAAGMVVVTSRRRKGNGGQSAGDGDVSYWK